MKCGICGADVPASSEFCPICSSAIFSPPVIKLSAAVAEAPTSSPSRTPLWQYVVMTSLFLVILLLCFTQGPLVRSFFAGVLAKTVLYVLLLTTFYLWKDSLKSGVRSAVITSLIAIPLMLAFLYLANPNSVFVGQSQRASEVAQSEDVKALVANVNDTLAPANAPKLSSENREDRTRAYANSPTTGTSQLADTQRGFKAFIAKALALRNQFKDASSRMDWDSILDPDRLTNDKEMTQSTVMVDAMTKATAAFVGGMHDLIDGLPPDTSVVMNSEAKQLMFRSLDLQQKETAEVGEVIDFLKHIKGQWSVGSKHILFQKQSDSDKYNEYLHELFTTDSDLQAVEAKRLALANAGLDQMRQLGK